MNNFKVEKSTIVKVITGLTGTLWLATCIWCFIGETTYNFKTIGLFVIGLLIDVCVFISLLPHVYVAGNDFKYRNIILYKKGNFKNIKEIKKIVRINKDAQGGEVYNVYKFYNKDDKKMFELSEHYNNTKRVVDLAISCGAKVSK